MSEQHSQAGLSRTAAAASVELRRSISHNDPPQPQNLEDADPPTPPAQPRRALLPPDVAEPPRRPSEPSEAWMQDALRSLPPAAQREAMRQHRPSSVAASTAATAATGYPPHDERSQDDRHRRRLVRIQSGASAGSQASAGRSSQSSKGRDNESSWMSRFTRAAARSGGPSQQPKSPELASPRLAPSSGDHLLSVSRTKAARKQARRDARRAKRAAEKEQQRREDEGYRRDSDDDEIITIDGGGEEPPRVPISRLPSSSRSRRATKTGGDIVDLPDAPPLDVPEANAPTATALAEAAKAARKPKRKLQFAPEQKRVRKADLPDDYEAGDLYRGLDDYVEAARQRRRKERGAASRRSRKKRSARSSRGSRSSAASSKTSDSSSSSSSSSDDSDSSSSSSSSGSGHGLTMARLRAFFGDSSSSSSSSSSDSDSDSDDSSSSTSSSSTSVRSSSAGRSHGRRRMARSRTFSISRGARSRRQGRRSSRGAASEDSDSDAGSPTSSRQGPLTPYLGPLADLQLVRKSRTKKQAKRARRAAKRAKKREAQLIKEGRLPPKPSRSARAKAARARDMAGGVTEYQLFTPMPLPMNTAAAELGTAEDAAGSTPVSSSSSRAKADVVYRRTMRTTSWDAVRQHFHVLRHYLKQVDGQGGDMGVSSSSTNVKGVGKDTGATESSGEAGRSKAKGSTPAEERSFALELSPLQLGETDFDGGDLSLPPPALDLPPETVGVDRSRQSDQAAAADEATPRTKPLSVSSMLASNSQRNEPLQAEFPSYDREMEGRTGVRMSDLPLSPHMSNDFARDFDRGFGRSPRAFRRQAPPLPDPHQDDGRGSARGPGRKHGRREGPAKNKTSKQARYRQLFEAHDGSGSGGDGGSSRSGPGWPGGPGLPGSAGGFQQPQGAEGAWWLDVRCPTYKDMQEISKLFPLHPLTVEDVLQQDPREKVDVFDKLGYYLVVIRAIDERYFRYTSSSGKNPDGSPRMTGSDKQPPPSRRGGSHEGSETTAAASGSPNEKQQSAEEKHEADRSGEPSFEMDDLTRKPAATADPTERQQSTKARTAGAADGEHSSSPDWRSQREGAVTTTMTRRAHVEIVEGVGGKEGLEGVSVGANNLYLIVFAHGVISFSFDDVSKHTERVLRRLLEITQPVELTADWIAHGLYDSVVDAFLPLLSFVQSEVLEIETITNDSDVTGWNKSKGSNMAPKRRRQRALMGNHPQGRLISVEPVFLGSGGGNSSRSPTTSSSSPSNEKAGAMGGGVTPLPLDRPAEMLEARRLKTVVVLRLLPFIHLPERVLDWLPFFLVKRRQHVTIQRLPTWEFQEALDEEMRKTAAEIDEAGNTVFDTQAAADQSSMIHRIADTRKIVTGLSRLLGPKNDAVKGLRKRLADLQQLQRIEERSRPINPTATATATAGGSSSKSRQMVVVGASSRTHLARTEVSMYMSDVHDHILSMLTHLLSSESRLSEIHFSFLSRIDIENRKFRQGSDSAILTLASVAVAVLMMQYSTSIFSMNVHVPGQHDGRPGQPHWWWMGILLSIACIPPLVYAYVRLLYRRSRDRLSNISAAR